MTEIIPDTSKYDDLPNKLRALAAIIADGGAVQCSKEAPTLLWAPSMMDSGALPSLMASGVHYRIKPKPRELWATFNRNGEIVSVDKECPPVARQFDTVVRFVEQQ